jgi:hypothetical protein
MTYKIETTFGYSTSKDRIRGNRMSSTLRDQIRNAESVRKFYGLSHTQWKKMPSDIRAAFVKSIVFEKVPLYMAKKTPEFYRTPIHTRLYK